MELRLTHGRNDPEQLMEEWGYDGPVLSDVDSVQQVYGETTTVRFTSIAAREVARALTDWEIWDATTLEVRGRDGLIEARSYGEPSQFFASLSLADSSLPSTVRINRDACVDTRNFLIDALGCTQQALRSMAQPTRKSSG